MVSDFSQQVLATAQFIHSVFPEEQKVPLHAPRLLGKEKTYLADCIDSTYVSYVGKYVPQFEQEVAGYIGAAHGVAFVNGTAALHLALNVVGVNPGDAVIVQPLTFVATANAVAHCGAVPCFVDVEDDTLGMSPVALQEFLDSETTGVPGKLMSKRTGRRIAACVPMHTFGHPARIEEILHVCQDRGIPVVEDAAEGLGSLTGDKHVGTFGLCGVLSFNGNKIITTGGGGMVVTDDGKLAGALRHLSTTAKIPHPWEFNHDAVGFNFRMPNINAAVGCAQMERLGDFVERKRKLASTYAAFFDSIGIRFFREPLGARSNYWLSALVLRDKEQRDYMIENLNNAGIMARPAWTLLNELRMYQDCERGPLDRSRWLQERIVNIPSSVPITP